MVVKSLRSTARSLEELATCGVMLSAETKSALEVSLPLKSADTGLKMLFWGKLLTTSGKDYFITTGVSPDMAIVNGKPSPEPKWFFSQDCVTWMDLEACPEEQADKAAKLSSMLSGDPSKVFTYYEAQPLPEPEPVPEPAEGEEPAEPEPVEPLPDLEFPVTEMERLGHMVKTVYLETLLAPAGAWCVTAENKVMESQVYAGLTYPDQLSSYHNKGTSLDKQVPGTWALTFDAFAQKAIVRSLLYPGASFYYCGQTTMYGSLYCGSGLKNSDLAFML